MPLSRLGCPLSLNTANMGFPIAMTSQASRAELSAEIRLVEFGDATDYFSDGEEL